MITIIHIDKKYIKHTFIPIINSSYTLDIILKIGSIVKIIY